MAQQTAVEWLIRNVNENIPPLYIPKQVVEQAKQMEKEQIEDAHIEGQRVFDKHPHTEWTNHQAEQYYKETYGSNN